MILNRNLEMLVPDFEYVSHGMWMLVWLWPIFLHVLSTRLIYILTSWVLCDPTWDPFFFLISKMGPLQNTSFMILCSGLTPPVELKGDNGGVKSLYYHLTDVSILLKEEFHLKSLEETLMMLIIIY
jgi:hypothetical protein